MRNKTKQPKVPVSKTPHPECFNRAVLMERARASADSAAKPQTRGKTWHLPNYVFAVSNCVTIQSVKC